MEHQRLGSRVRVWSLGCHCSLSLSLSLDMSNYLFIHLFILNKFVSVCFWVHSLSSCSRYQRERVKCPLFTNNEWIGETSKKHVNHDMHTSFLIRSHSLSLLKHFFLVAKYLFHSAPCRKREPTLNANWSCSLYFSFYFNTFCSPRKICTNCSEIALFKPL